MAITTTTAIIGTVVIRIVAILETADKVDIATPRGDIRGHQNSGNNGNGGNQNNGNISSGNNGFGSHQDHQEGGNHGITQPADHLHHFSKGAPMMDAESSDDDSDFP